MELVDEALRMCREGDLEGALQLLRELKNDGGAAASLRFQLLTKGGPCEEALQVASDALAVVTTPLARSTWALRRGLLHLEERRRGDAVRDLQLVLSLRANEGHLEQARAALLRAAELPKR